MDESSIRVSLKREKSIQLSSLYSKVFIALLFLIGSTQTISSINNYKLGYFLPDEILYLIVMIIALIQSIYFIRYAVDLELEGRQLRMKHFFGKRIRLDLDAVRVEKSSKYKSFFYTTIFYTHESKEHKAVTINLNSFLLGKEISASKIIEIAKNYFKSS